MQEKPGGNSEFSLTKEDPKTLHRRVVLNRRIVKKEIARRTKTIKISNYFHKLAALFITASTGACLP